MHFKLGSCFITRHFCQTSEGYWVTPYNRQKYLFSWTSYIHDTHKSSVLPQHTENTKHKIQKHAFKGDHFGIAAVSTPHILLPFETPLCNVFLGTAERGCGDSQLQESWLTCIYLQSADCAKRKWEWQVAVRTFHHSIIQWASRVLSLVC